MSSRRVIAAAQTVPIRGDVDANLERHLRLTEAAAGERAQLLVFPELSLTGYELDLAPRLAFAPDDSRLDPLIEAAQRGCLTLVVGAPVRVGAKLHIGAFILSPDRSVALYTKQRLGAFGPEASPDGIVPPAEASVFQPGDQNPLVDFDGHLAAVAVCADIGDPAHPAAAAARGARTYIASMFVIPGELERERQNLCGYAAKHSMAVVLANFGGPSGGLPSGGTSTAWSENGELVGHLGAAGEHVLIAREGVGRWRADTLTARS